MSSCGSSLLVPSSSLIGVADSFSGRDSASKVLLVGVFLGEDLADGSDLIATLLQIDDAHALRSTTLDGDISSVDTDRDTTLIDDHQVVLIGDGTDSYELTRLIGDVEGLDTLSCHDS